MGVALVAIVSVGLVVVALVLAPASDDSADSSGSAGSSGSRGSAETPSEQALRSALREQFDLPDDASIDLGPAVPGVLVFHAYVPGQPNSGITGVFDGQIRTDPDEAVPVVLDAMAFGARRDRPGHCRRGRWHAAGKPRDTVRHAVRHRPVRRPGDDEPAARITVDGRPAVEFWNMTARRPPWRSQVVSRADGTYDVIELPPS